MTAGKTYCIGVLCLALGLLVRLTAVLALLIALPLGVLAAVHRNTWIDVGATIFAVLVASSPVFFTGILLILAAIGLSQLPFDWRGASLILIAGWVLPAAVRAGGRFPFTSRAARSSRR